MMIPRLFPDGSSLHLSSREARLVWINKTSEAPDAKPQEQNEAQNLRKELKQVRQELSSMHQLLNAVVAKQQPLLIPTPAVQQGINYQARHSQTSSAPRMRRRFVNGVAYMEQYDPSRPYLEGRPIASTFKTTEQIRRDQVTLESTTAAARRKEAQERAEKLKSLDRTRARSFDGRAPIISEGELREYADASPQRAAAQLHEIYAQTDGGIRMPDGSISYAPGQEKFNPDNDGGTYGTSSTLGRTTWDRQVNSPRFQKEQAEVQARKSNDKPREQYAPMIEAQLRSFFNQYDTCIRVAQSMRGEGKSFTEFLPPGKEEIERLRTIWINRRINRSQDSYGDMKIIAGQLEKLQKDNPGINEVFARAANAKKLKDSRSSGLDTSKGNSVASTTELQHTNPTQREKVKGPSGDTESAPAEVKSTPSTPVAPPPNNYSQRAPSEQRERPRKTAEHSVPIDVRSAPDRSVRITVLDPEKGAVPILYEPTGGRKFWMSHDAMNADTYGVRFERRINPRSGVTHYVDAVFTKPGTYMVNGKRYVLDARGGWREEKTTLPDYIKNAKYMGPLYDNRYGEPGELHIISREPGNTTESNLRVQGMTIGELRTSEDGMYSVYKSDMNRLHLVAHQPGMLEIVGRFYKSNNRQASLGRYNISPQDIVRRPEPDPLPAPEPDPEEMELSEIERVIKEGDKILGESKQKKEEPPKEEAQKKA